MRQHGAIFQKVVIFKSVGYFIEFPSIREAPISFGSEIGLEERIKIQEIRVLV
jgi:hypothetical protein